MRQSLLFLLYCLLSVKVFSQTDSTKLAKDSLQGMPSVTTAVVPPDSLNKIKDSINVAETPAVPASTPAVIAPAANTVQPAPPVTKTQPGDTVKKVLPVYDAKKYAKIRTSPDSVKFAALDSLTPEQLLEYYITEPEPPNTGKRTSKGDTTYSILNPLTVPTRTVEGEALSHVFFEPPPSDSVLSNIEQQMRPKISMGLGRLGFHGDLYQYHYQSPLLGKPAFDLAISQRLTRYLQLDFSMLFGKMGANEYLSNRHENMLTEIKAGGVNLIYDFGNLLPARHHIRPYVSFGVYGFEFLSKTDLKDSQGRKYYYWSDGSIKDRAEGSPDAQFANNLVRDYTYESDIREQNKDGFGKYREAAWAFPLGVGIIMKITDRVDMKFNYQYYLSTTDFIDGISDKSIGDRVGNKRNDNFSYLSVALQYDLIAKKIRRIRPQGDSIEYNSPYMLALYYQDNDNDSIIDVNDACPGTPSGVQVDARGCPLDGDDDGVPDFKDDELATVGNLGVNAKGVARDDAYWQNWYDNFMNDSLPGDRVTEYTGNIYAVSKKKDRKDPYTVELMRYNGAIPSDELAFLLSIGDINSTTLEDGTTVVYTSGNYEKLGSAIKRRDEFREEGNKKAGVSMFKGRDVVQLPEDELENLLKNEIADLLKLNVNDSINNLANVVTTNTPDEAFNKNEIVYRVQLGAFRNKISTSVFGNNIGVLELKTGENVYRYVTKGYPTIEEAAATRADLVVQGYSDAFVTAYRGGRRIPMSETKATVEKDFKEDLSEDKTFSSIDKNLLAFKVQLGPLKKKAQEAAMDARVKDLEGVSKKVTPSGALRYTCGSFPGLELAEEFRKTLEAKGFTDAFVIPTFKEEVISMQEAMELLK